MKAEIIAALEKLLENEDVLEVQKEFKKLSTQFKSFRVNPTAEDEKAAGSAETSKETEVASQSNFSAQDATKSTTGSSESLKSSPELADKSIGITESKTDEEHTASEAHATKSDEPAELNPDDSDDTIAPENTIDNGVKEAGHTEEPSSEESENTNDTITENIPAAEDLIENGNDTSAKMETVQPSDDKAAESADASPEIHGGSSQTESTVEEVDILDEKFKELTELFKTRISEAKATRKKIEEETLAKAKDLLAELEKLVAQEENIGKAFSGFNAIRDHWKALPKVSNDDYRDLNMEYNKLVERFFYNINIYKELKELDLKHNLEQKLLVLEDQKKLLELNDIRLLEVEVRMNQDRWNEIGPTFKDDWEKLKDEFWSITRTIYGKIQAFYDQRREEFEKNLEAKKALLEEVKRIEQLELKSPKKWQEKTKLVIDLQHQWKMIGFVPKEKAGSIWKEFRKTCDAFFEKKRQHFAEIHEVHEANKLAKEKLVNQAEQLKDSQEWNETSKVLIQLQNDWKGIGPAHQRDDNALWRRFRQACDHFFTARNAQKSGESAEQAENLTKKKALIEKIAAHKPGPDSSSNIEQLKAFGEEWRAIGHVPFKEKDAINKAYKKVMDEQFDSLKIERKVRQQVQFEEKVENLKEARGGERLLQKEEDFIRNKINKIRAEINQYENNMGFFANSKGAEKLKEEVIKKIDKAKAEVEELEGQLQLLRNA